MKADIHPQYHKSAEVKCGNGATRRLGATYDTRRDEICSKCHPFYTGEEKLMDTAGRVEKFKARKERAKTAVRKKSEKKAVKKAKKSR